MKNIDKSKTYSAFLLLAITLFVALILFVTPVVRRDKLVALEKSCYSNMRVLLGAVEISPSYFPPCCNNGIDVDCLVKSKYLRKLPIKPTDMCEYSTTGDLRDTGLICCKEHGTVEGDGPKPPPPSIFFVVMDTTLKLPAKVVSAFKGFVSRVIKFIS